MANFSIEIEGREKLSLELGKATDAVSDWSEQWGTVEDWFFEIEETLFQSGGASGANGKWQKLSPAYEAVKIKKYDTFALLAGVMIASERLSKSLTRKTGDTVIQKSKDEFAIGTSLPYAKPHQTGAGNLPERKVIDPTDAQVKDLRKRIKKNLLALLKRRTTLIVKDTDYGDIG
jgi:phage gpG-like protein